MPADPIPLNTAAVAPASDHSSGDLILFDSAPSGAIRLEECETKLREIIIAGTVAAGTILRRIRDETLYKDDHPNFEEYLLNRWGWTYSYANRLINAAGFCDYLATLPIGKVVFPTAESQIRPLLQLKDRESQGAAWEMAVTKAEGRVPTAEQVKAVVDSLVPPKGQKSGKQSPKPPEAERIVSENDEGEASQRGPSSQQSPAPMTAPTEEGKGEKDDLGPDPISEDTTDREDETGDGGGGPEASQVQEIVDEVLSQKPKGGKHSPTRVDPDPEISGDDYEQLLGGEPSELGQPQTPPAPAPRDNTEIGQPTSFAPSDPTAPNDVPIRHPCSVGAPGDPVETPSLVEPRGSSLPEGLVEKARHLTGGKSTEETERRKHFVGIAAETIERACQENDALTLMDVLDTFKYALAMLERAYESGFRKKGKSN